VFTILGASATLEGCDFVENFGIGAGYFAIGGTSTLAACRFIDNNAARGFGGGAIVEAATATFSNCLFAGNFALLGGAGLLASDSAAVDVINCTLSGNTATFYAGGIQVETGAIVQLGNTIAWGNDAPEQIVVLDGDLDAEYSNIQGGWPGTGNIDRDPLFVDPDAGDYHVLGTSPTDAGANCLLPTGVVTDLDGNSRFVDHPGAPNVGVPGCEGGSAIVDIGAYERQCRADCNGDGALNILDFVAFQNAWRAADPKADCDDNGAFNILDFICFQQLFVAGCP
jgi:hypothetical protein